MKVTDFNYNLPEELIAQVPIEKRDESRLMVLDRNKQTIEHKVFKDIIDYLQPGDCLVRNNTKVLPARLYGKKETGAHVEFLLLNRIEGDIWECIVRPGNKLHVGAKVSFGDGLLNAEVLDTMPGGTRKVLFTYKGIFNEILDKIGLMPLPPYIHEELKEKDIKFLNPFLPFEAKNLAKTIMELPEFAEYNFMAYSYQLYHNRLLYSIMWLSDSEIKYYLTSNFITFS